MLIIKGTAELMKGYDSFTQGSRYEFTMFSANMPLESQLNKIEDYLVSRGWDNIEITENGTLASNDEIQHPVLLAAYQKAEQEGFAVTIYNSPLT